MNSTFLLEFIKNGTECVQENINQSMPRNKHSVNVSHKYYSITVFLSRCKFLLVVVGAFPGTGCCLFLPVVGLSVLEG